MPYTVASKCALVCKDWNSEVCYTLHDQQTIPYQCWESLMTEQGTMYRVAQRRYTVISIFDALLTYKYCYMGSSSPNYSFTTNKDGDIIHMTIRDYAFDRLIRAFHWNQGNVKGTWVTVNISGKHYTFPFNIALLETKTAKK
uniref:Uncharacterized protein n=1 Tax=Clandestinovirus TaxID=2831644 RepID=A0A8F8KKX2_9VIRU|nr:hypothetical protein KOM_12_299 [Clandestinovirus]